MPVSDLLCFCFALFPIAEAAEQLGKNAKLVERLVEWCEAKDHAGVMGESNRLLSALIRHSKSKVSPRGRHTLTGIRVAMVGASTVESVPYAYIHMDFL